jgi:hypothetical protein
MPKLPHFSTTPTADAVIEAGDVRADRWIIGEGCDSQFEYLVHLGQPRFACKVDVDDDAKVSKVFNIELEAGERLYDFVWLDGQAPDPEALKALAKIATAALERNARKLGY